MTSAAFAPLPLQAKSLDQVATIFPLGDKFPCNPGDHHVVPDVLHGHHPVVPHGDDNDLIL